MSCFSRCTAHERQLQHAEIPEIDVVATVEIERRTVRRRAAAGAGDAMEERREVEEIDVTVAVTFTRDSRRWNKAPKSSPPQMIGKRRAKSCRPP